MSDIKEINGEFDLSGLNRLTWPIAWQGAPDLEYEQALSTLVLEAKEALTSDPDATRVGIENGQVVSTIRD